MRRSSQPAAKYSVAAIMAVVVVLVVVLVLSLALVLLEAAVEPSAPNTGELYCRWKMKISKVRMWMMTF
jgi:hypothetical protein